MTRRRFAPDSPLGLVGIAVAVALYAWWATGVPPFTVRAYIAVGVPALLLVVVALATPASVGGKAISVRSLPGEDHEAQRTFPWVVLLVLAVSLEGLGLALGGRSRAVPTLSTVIDHALSHHVVRFVLFLAWLVAGWAPLWRMKQASSAHLDDIH